MKGHWIYYVEPLMNDAGGYTYAWIAVFVLDEP